MQDIIFAAGTVCWHKISDGKIKVLLIRRKKHNDWSFPKGKVDDGESLPQTAVRETLEETGLQVRLGTNLGTINYRVSSKKGGGKKGGSKTGQGKSEQGKTVQYWAAKVSRKTVRDYKFKRNNEVKKVKWVSVDKVQKWLTYPADRELFKVFEQLVKEDAHDTFAVTLLRHAKAAPRSSEWVNRDSERPLTDQGVHQTQIIVPTLVAFGPKKIISSTALRCLDTVAPLADHLRVVVEEDHSISQDAWEAGEVAGLRDRVAGVVNGGRSTILCSHSPVLPDLAREVAAATVSAPGRYLASGADLPTAGFSIFHISKNAGIVSVETYPIKV